MRPRRTRRRNIDVDVTWAVVEQPEPLRRNPVLQDFLAPYAVITAAGIILGKVIFRLERPKVFAGWGVIGDLNAEGAQIALDLVKFKRSGILISGTAGLPQISVGIRDPLAVGPLPEVGKGHPLGWDPVMHACIGMVIRLVSLIGQVA